MNCTRSHSDIQALIDGTLGPIRVAELEQHLDQCDACRALANDLRRIRDLADTLDEPVPPDHVWLQIAGRLRQEGRVHDRVATVAIGHRQPRQSRQVLWLGIAAALVLAVGGSLLLLLPQFTGSTTGPGRATEQSNAAGADAVQSGVEDLRKAERLLQSGVAKLKEGLGSENQALPIDMTGTLDRNLQILDQAITESSDALQKEPQNVAARNSLFEALQRKISLLQDTITLMNEMRKGNAAGVAQVVEGANKS
jgi:anti-sigma factor RsiW